MPAHDHRRPERGDAPADPRDQAIIRHQLGQLVEPAPPVHRSGQLQNRQSPPQFRIDGQHSLHADIQHLIAFEHPAQQQRHARKLQPLVFRRIKPSFAEFFYLIPYPGSDLYREAVENHWIVDDTYEGRGMVDRPVLEIHFTRAEQIGIRREYFRMMAWRNLSGYLSPSVLWNVVVSVRPGMVKAFAREFRRTRNLRDAMQAYVHALRNHFAEAAGRRRA